MEWQRDFEHTANNCAWWEVTNEHTANNCAWWEVINWMTSSSLWMKKNHYMVGQNLHIFYSFLLSHQYVWYKSIFFCLLYRLTFRSKMQDDIPWHFMMFHVYPTKLDFCLRDFVVYPHAVAGHFVPSSYWDTVSHHHRSPSWKKEVNNVAVENAMWEAGSEAVHGCTVSVKISLKTRAFSCHV